MQFPMAFLNFSEKTNDKYNAFTSFVKWFSLVSNEFAFGWFLAVVGWSAIPFDIG
jgi:hypothetical protein